MTAAKMWQRAERGKKLVRDLEHAAILRALVEADWHIMRAARILRPGLDAHAANGWLSKMLQPLGRHAELGAIARAQLAASGYIAGRPARATDLQKRATPRKRP